MKVRDNLGDRFGKDFFFISITLLPSEDSPAILRRYAERYGIPDKPGWTFVTGRPRDIELLRKRLGFSYVDRKLDADRTNHIRLVLLGNEPYRWWGTLPGADMTSNQITQYLKWMEPGVSGMKTPQTISRRE